MIFIFKRAQSCREVTKLLEASSASCDLLSIALEVTAWSCIGSDGDKGDRAKEGQSNAFHVTEGKMWLAERGLWERSYRSCGWLKLGENLSVSDPCSRLAQISRTCVMKPYLAPGMSLIEL